MQSTNWVDWPSCWSFPCLKTRREKDDEWKGKERKPEMEQQVSKTINTWRRKELGQIKQRLRSEVKDMQANTNEKWHTTELIKKLGIWNKRLPLGESQYASLRQWEIGQHCPERVRHDITSIVQPSLLTPEFCRGRDHQTLPCTCHTGNINYVMVCVCLPSAHSLPPLMCSLLSTASSLHPGCSSLPLTPL